MQLMGREISPAFATRPTARQTQTMPLDFTRPVISVSG
jgi:hypothetical protein